MKPSPGGTKMNFLLSGIYFLFNLKSPNPKHPHIHISHFIQIFIFRLQVIKILRDQWKAGKLHSDWFAADKDASESGHGETPEEYLKRMARPGVLQDHLFLTGLAHLLGHDLVFLAVHEASVQKKLFT